MRFEVQFLWDQPGIVYMGSELVREQQIETLRMPVGSAYRARKQKKSNLDEVRLPKRRLNRWSHDLRLIAKAHREVTAQKWRS